MTALADYLDTLNFQEAFQGQRRMPMPGTPEWDEHHRKVCRDMHRQTQALEAKYGPFNKEI